MKRSRWISPLLILTTSSGLFGCGQALEQALAPDPSTKTWSGEQLQTPPSKPNLPQSSTAQVETPNETIIQSTPQRFADIAAAPNNLQAYIEDLARLEVLNPRGETEDGDPLFSPNQPIKRGTFVRWLVQTNNRIHRDRPTRQFRLASKDASDPVYTDVPQSHPDFTYIQGLAEAGYLPSPLTGDEADKTFQPDVALSRESLLLWKVPIDQQKLLPTVTVAKVKETWGFKDAEQVSPKAASAIVADHTNNELSNIRRLIGASLLLQPKKAVSRAEATAALWYFGIDGQGFSAKDIVRAEVQSTASEALELSTEPPNETPVDQPRQNTQDTSAPSEETRPNNSSEKSSTN